MAAWSDYAEKAIIDHVFRGAPFSAPSSLFFGLFTTSPTDAGGGTEVSGGAYERAELACSETNWADPGTSGVTTNQIAVTFPQPSGASWGTVVAVGLFDAATGGNLIAWGAVSPSKTIADGDAAPQFAAGDFQFQIDN
jgi:hypothetical protein